MDKIKIAPYLSSYFTFGILLIAHISFLSIIVGHIVDQRLSKDLKPIEAKINKILNAQEVLRNPKSLNYKPASIFNP